MLFYDCDSSQLPTRLKIIPARDPKQCGGQKDTRLWGGDDDDDDDDDGDDTQT